jgi:P-type Cu2+ transporter
MENMEHNHHHDMNQEMKMDHQNMGHDHSHMISDYKKRLWISLVVTVPILILSPMLQMFFGLGEKIRFTGDSYLLFAFSTFIFLYGGWPFLKGFVVELKTKQVGMMTLIALAISTAYLYSSVVVFGLPGSIFFWELATLIDIMLLGHWIEMRAVMGASKSLEELAKMMPSDAHKILADGTLIDVPLVELAPDDKVMVKPGEKIPADGDVIDGDTTVNESMLTGESIPIFKTVGAKVIGGSINGEGSITIQVKKLGQDSFLSQVINLVKEAQDSKSRTQDLANRFAFWLTIIAISTGVLTLFVWTLAVGMDFAFSIERAVTVMVITCPHALGLAVPLVVAVSTALAGRNGLLIRDRVAFENARKLNAVIFDKTGTLTEGKFGVTDVIVLDDTMEKEDLLKYAASLEENSEHPISKGIVSVSSQRYSVDSFNAVPGKGVEGIVNGKEIKVVSPGYLKEKDLAFSNQQVALLSQQGKTVVFVIMDGSICGAIALADLIRPESKAAITRLKSMGIRCMMLTGDNKNVAKWVSDEIGLDEYFAEVLPNQKADKVKEVQARGLIVGMTGDGINDAPALAQSDVGIAVGAGTDVAIETADIILVRSDPSDVVAIIGLAKATYRKMVQNLILGAGYNIIAIPLAAGVAYGAGIILTPAVGAALMSLSTIVVAINATRLHYK